MIKRWFGGLYAFAIAIAMLAFGRCEAANESKAGKPMASQLWTKTYVSNEVSTVKSDLQKWTVDYVDGKAFPEVDKDKEMWFDGTNLCVKVNGVVYKMKLSSGVIAPQTYGFSVSNVHVNDGVVSSGMFYADVGDLTYKCPSNTRIPTIRYTHTITQTVEGVSYEYKKFDIIETAREDDGTVRTVKWNTLQQDNSTWKVYREIENPDRTVDILWFYIQYTKGTALPESPLAYHERNFKPRGRFDGMSFFEIIGEILFPSACADDLNVNVGGSGFNMTVTIIAIDDQGIQRKIGDFYAPYHGPSAYWGKGGPVSDVKDTIWEEKVTEGGEEVKYTKTRSPSFYPLESDFKRVSNWLENTYPVSFEMSYIADEDEDGNPIYETMPISTTISSGEIYNACRTKIDEILGGWREPDIITLKKEKSEDCEHGYHVYDDDTCVCSLCYHYRVHHLVDNPEDEDDCKLCDKPLGKFKDSTIPDGDYEWCGGRGLTTDDHRKFHAYLTSATYNPYSFPPNGKTGYRYQCACSCGYYGKDNDLSHDIPSDYTRIDAGDLFGNQKEKYHVKMFECSRCEYNKGWIARQESHRAQNGVTHPCYIEYDGEDEEKIEAIAVPTRYPFEEVDGHTASEVFHLVDNGVCSECEHEVKGASEHNFNGGCICTDCGVQVHVWDTDVSANCPKAAYCKQCGNWFGREEETGYIYFDSIGEDHHEFAVPFEIMNLENHHCKCRKQVEQPHYWGRDSGEGADPDEYCKDPETETLDGNGNVIRGCGIKRHQQENCPMNRAIGECGNWYCPICLKPLTHDKDGKEAPRTHAPTVHSGTSKKCDHYGSATIGGVFHCAVCKHTFMGGTCGTRLGDDGNPVYVGHPLTSGDDYKLHFGWKENASYPAQSHECKCHQLDQTQGFSRSHNWGDLECRVKYNADGSADQYKHKRVRKCNHKTSGVQDSETCNYVDGEDASHYLVSTDSTKDVFINNANNECMQQLVCHEKDSYGHVRGCNLNVERRAIHDYRWPSSVGEPDQWKCGEGDEIERCYRAEICEHGTKLRREGCGHVRYEFAESGGHKKKYESSTQIEGQEGFDKHLTHIVCDRNCGYTKDEKLDHAWVLKAFKIDETNHQNYVSCEKESNENSPCHKTENTTIAKHKKAYGDTVFVDNHYHRDENHCNECESDYYLNKVYHDGYFHQIYDHYKFSGVNYGDIYLVGDPYGFHSKSNYCNNCNSYYELGEPCDYHKESDWVLSDDESLNEPRSYDVATCELCHEAVRLEHTIHAIDGMHHGCQHQTIAGNSPWHLIEEHNFSYGECTVCHYHPDDSTVCGECGCCSRNGGDVKCEYGWDYENDKCGCRHCKYGEGNTCYCKIFDTTIDKLTNPTILGMIGRMSYNSELREVDGDDPVYMIGRSGFESAYKQCENLTTIKLNFVTNIAERGCYDFASECGSLSEIGFRDLRVIGNEGMKDAFHGSGGVDFRFPNLEEIGDHGMEGIAWKDGFGAIGRILDFRKLKHIGDYGMAGCFPNAGISSIEKGGTQFNNVIALENVETIGEHAFDGSFTNSFGYTGLALWLPKLSEIPPYAFANSSFKYFDFGEPIRGKFINTNAFYGCSSIETIPTDTVTCNIGKGAYKKSGIIRAITSCSLIEDEAFMNCENLQRVECVSCRRIGKEAFKDCFNLSALVLEGVQTIGDSAFFQNYNVEIQNQAVYCVYIKDYAFFSCRKLKLYEIFSNSIGVSAFEGCENIVNLYVSSYSRDADVTIGRHAFSSCVGMTVIDFGGITGNLTIGEDIFLYCNALKNVYLNRKTKQYVIDNSYFGAPKDCIFHCSDGNVTVP